jgi:hypothetical protein
MQKIKFWFKIISLFLLWGFLLPRFVKAQTLDRYVIATAGQNLSGSGFSLLFTLGEPVAQTFENGQTLAQGFQQEWLTTTPVDDLSGEDWAVRVFPNPTVGVLQIETEAPMQVQLFDMSGRLIQSAEVENGGGEMDLGQLPAGTYFLVMYNAEKAGKKSFRIVKTQ